MISNQDYRPRSKVKVEIRCQECAIFNVVICHTLVHYIIHQHHRWYNYFNVSLNHYLIIDN